MSGYYYQPQTPTQTSGFPPHTPHNEYRPQQQPPPRPFTNQPPPTEFYQAYNQSNGYSQSFQAYPSPPHVPRSPSVPAYTSTQIPQQHQASLLQQRQQSFSPMTPAQTPIQSQVMQRAKTLDQMAQLQKYQAEHTVASNPPLPARTIPRHAHSPSLPAPMKHTQSAIAAGLPLSLTPGRVLPSPQFHRQQSMTKDEPLPPLPQRSGTMPPGTNAFPPRPAIPHTVSTSSSRSSSPKRPLPLPEARSQAPPATRQQSMDFSRFGSDAQAQLSRLNTRSVSPPKSRDMYNAVSPDSTPTRRRASPPRFQATPSSSNEPIQPPQHPSRVLSNRRELASGLPPRSNSPAKIAEDLPALAESGKAFVPLWKRNLAQRSSPAPAPAPAPVPASIPTSEPMKRASTATNGGRPLPSRPPISPTKSTFPLSRTNSQVSLSDSEDDSEADTQSIVSHTSSRPPPSPQYGIRDLPSRQIKEEFKVDSPSSSPKHGIRDLPSMPGSPGKRNRPFPQPPSIVSQSQSLPGLPKPPSQRPQPPQMTSQSQSTSGFSRPAAQSTFQPSQVPQHSNTSEPRSSTIMQLAQISLQEDTSMSHKPAVPAGTGSGFTRKGNAPQWPSNIPPLPRAPQQPSQASSAFADRQSPTRSPRRRDFVNLDDSPPLSIRHSPSPGPGPSSQYSPRMKYSSPERTPISHPRPMPPAKAEASAVQIESPSPLGGRDKRPDIPTISLPDSDGDGHGGVPQIQVQSADPPQITVFEVPGISVDNGFGASDGPQISVSSDDFGEPSAPPRGRAPRKIYRGDGLICGGCGGPIIGRIVAAMGIKWHPQCFKCSVCDENLEHVSSYEHEGLPYCHLDYHENFAPKCYHCKTPIIEERFISLDDTALGKRAYHEPHFFCSECGDPFMDPSNSSNNSRKGELTISGDGVFTSEDDVGFVVYKGYPYCEACHVRLRLPKCKRCGKSIRDHMEAVEALGGKWCWECFVCAGCERPFDNPSFFEREGHPFCERCYSIILRNDV